MIDRAALVAALDAAEAHLLDREMCTTIYDHGARTRRVVVLLHGLTASPRTWRDFALERHRRGENVLVPRLPRHGHADRRTTALSALSAEELRAAAERIVDAAAVLGDEIVLVGHSLGGALALHVAHADRRIFRAIAIAPFLGIRPLPHPWHRALRRVLDRAPNAFLYWDPIGRGRDEPGHGYARYTTRSLAAGLAIAEALQTEAAIRGPLASHVEIVLNEREASVNNAAIDELVSRWRRAGGPSCVRLHRLVGLRTSHDIVEPERPGAPALLFLPQLHALLDAPVPDADLRIDLTR